MAIIQIKRGIQEAVSRLSLAQGEMAVALDTGNVYIGTASGNVHVNPSGGTADTAAALKNARDFSISGDASAPAVSFDGTQNVNLVLTLADMAGLTTGTYTKITVDAKGRVISGSSIEISDLPSIPLSKITGTGTAAAKDAGTAAGNVAELQSNGKLLASIIPDLAGTYVAVGTTINGKPLSSNVTLSADDVGAIPVSQKGSASGVASLGDDGKVPSSQLPSYVDDVVEYESREAFPQTGEDGKIYVAEDTNLTYRWSGSAYVEISPSLALGTTASTAYYGDKGQAAYDHSQITSGNPHGTTAAQIGAAPSSHVSTVASASQLGHIKISDAFTIDTDGTIKLAVVDGGTFE